MVAFARCRRDDDGRDAEACKDDNLIGLSDEDLAVRTALDKIASRPAAGHCGDFEPIGIDQADGAIVVIDD
jgi:hypothetical protein